MQLIIQMDSHSSVRALETLCLDDIKATSSISYFLQHSLKALRSFIKQFLAEDLLKLRKNIK